MNRPPIPTATDLEHELRVHNIQAEADRRKTEQEIRHNLAMVQIGIDAASSLLDIVRERRLSRS